MFVGELGGEGVSLQDMDVEVDRGNLQRRIWLPCLVVASREVVMVREDLIQLGSQLCIDFNICITCIMCMLVVTLYTLTT